MEIYVLRHGIAEDNKPGRPDAERALTNEGREKLRRVLRRARAAAVDPSLILSSPYRRALETADVAAAELTYRGKIVQTRALEPDGSPAAVWKELTSRAGEEAILLATHEPLSGALVAFLLGNPSLAVDMKKGALVRIDCARLSGEPSGVLKWMLTPALASD